MSVLNKKRISVALVLLVLAAFPVASKSRKSTRLPLGTWGAPHIRINVEEKSATIDYDCANGTIDGPLTVNRNGTFSWRGSHNPEHAGPVRIDVPSAHHPALYTGRLKGKTLTLTVKLTDTNEVIDTYTLTLGGGGRVFKCR